MGPLDARCASWDLLGSAGIAKEEEPVIAASETLAVDDAQAHRLVWRFSSASKAATTDSASDGPARRYCTGYSCTSGRPPTGAVSGRREPETAMAIAGMNATRMSTSAQTNVEAKALASGPAMAACALAGRC